MLLVLMFQSNFVNGQNCEGNLGINIFFNGDFGSGIDNILQTDPQIAPGYQYTTNTPISDGYYIVSNSMAVWPNNYSSWLPIGDNSGDQNGYMMIVNASYDPGLFYKQTIDGLCENSLYAFSADIINVIKSTVAGHIKPNVSFLIDGVEYFTTGAIPQDEKWNTYGFTFSTDPGQTSVELSLRNNAPGGIGNDLALDNISFRACGPQAQILPFEIENICEDGSPIDLDATIIGDQYDNPTFQWQQSFDGGITWFDIPGETNPVYTHNDLSAGYYYYRYLLANGSSNILNYKCRVVSNVKVVHVVPKFYEIVDTICQGLAFQIGESFYDQSGLYEDSLISVIGCDSIISLDLTVVQDPGIEAEFRVTNPSCVGYSDGLIEISVYSKWNRTFSVFL